MRAVPAALAAVATVLGRRGLGGASASTVLVPNDVQIVAYASDAPDAVAFVTWVDLEPDTEIRFTDKGWEGCGNSGGFQSGESELRWTAPSAVPAGSVFEFVEGTTAEGPNLEWELLSGSFDLSSLDGDQMIVYQGSLEDPTMIFAFDTSGGWEDCGAVSGSKQSALPPGLVDGVSAVSFEHSDSFWYRPWYARSAILPTLKEWMVNRARFKTTSSQSTRDNDYEAPLTGFAIHAGEQGRHNYTEYIPGTAPCIILSGHDGDLYPDDIDDRNHGCWDGNACDWDKTCSPQNSDKCDAVTANDENTMDMARRANDHFLNHTGHSCHLVVNRLARIKLDPNREEGEAAQLDAVAIEAYEDFHGFADQASQDIVNNHPCGAGLLVDFHGHTHPEARIEMGYKLSSSQLRENDAIVDGLAYTSSIKNMPTHNNAFFSSVVRGSSSMGALFELPTGLNVSGYLSVPSPTVNAPLVGESYFQGGYNVETHGSQNGGSIDGVQIEFPRYLRAQEFGMQEDMLEAFGRTVLPEMLAAHYPAACDVMATPAPTTETSAPTPKPTLAPTTAAPSTSAPTTAAPSTSAPTTAAPSTSAPTTAAPSTSAPTTAAPSTSAPTTAAPTTAAPATSAPTTLAPTTAAPTSAAPVTPGPTAPHGVIAYDMVNSASSSLSSHTNDFAGAYDSSWDGFQKYARGAGFIPPYLRDDGHDPAMANVVVDDDSDTGKCCGFFHKYGIVDYSFDDEFFGVVDTDGDNAQGLTAGTAAWVFDIAGHGDIDVSIDMAAIGNFDNEDYFKWTASIDGGQAVDVFVSTVDTSGSHTYTLSDGYTKDFDDPLEVDGVVLENTFRTFTKSLNGLSISPNHGSALTLTLEAKMTSSFEPVAFKNVVISGMAVCGAWGDGCVSASYCCSGVCEGNGKCG